MSQTSLLTYAAQAMQRISVEWMLTGSLASSMYGEPRSTHDIDIVADLREQDISALISEFPEPRFYADAQMMRDAIQSRSMFNVLDQDSGDKIDFWAIGPEEFHRVQFDRRRIETFNNVNVSVISPEDSILSKLYWSKLSGGSERQLRDALRVYEVQHGVLDVEYCEQWAVSLDVLEMWQRIVCEATPIE